MSSVIHLIECKIHIDAGCGSGRFLDVVSRSNAHLVGIDATAAIDSAARMLTARGAWGRVALLQATIEDLPFREQSFDFIYSIGVLHHTPDIARGIRHLVRLLAPGGSLAIWLYYPSGTGMTLSNFWWPILRNLPERALLAFIRPFTALYPIYRLRPWGIPLRVLFPICMHPDPEMRLLGTFDSYSPRYNWQTTYPDAIRFFEEAGLMDIQIDPFPTSVRGRVKAS